MFGSALIDFTKSASPLRLIAYLIFLLSIMNEAAVMEILRKIDQINLEPFGENGYF